MLKKINFQRNEDVWGSELAMKVRRSSYLQFMYWQTNPVWNKIITITILQLCLYWKGRSMTEEHRVTQQRAVMSEFAFHQCQMGTCKGGMAESSPWANQLLHWCANQYGNCVTKQLWWGKVYKSYPELKIKHYINL